MPPKQTEEIFESNNKHINNNDDDDNSTNYWCLRFDMNERVSERMSGMGVNE